MMNEECPHCGGKLIEKHDEIVEERGKTIQVIHYRCISCGKWTEERMEPT